MIKFVRNSQLVERLRLGTLRRILLRHYHIQPGEENLCIVTKCSSELEMEVRTLMHPKEHEVLLRVGSCSISNDDYHSMARCEGKDQISDKTLVLGSFGTGIVLETGTGVQGMFNVGDRVAIEPGIYCQKCDHCKSGQTNLCSHIRYLGSKGLDGLLCRFINHPAQLIHKLPPGVSLEKGTLVTEIAGCIHGYRRSGATKDSKILIIGTGLVGLLIIMVFKHLGVGSIIVAETNNYKLKMAREAGADYVIKLASLSSPEYPEYLQQVIHSIQSGDQDVVIDTIGTSSSLENSFNLTKSGGKIMLMSRMIRPIEAKFVQMATREIDLLGAYSYTHNSFMEAINLLENNSIPLKKFIPVKIPLERALDAFSHGRATGGEIFFILVSSYDENKQSSGEKSASTPDLKPVPPPPTSASPMDDTKKESDTSKESQSKVTGSSTSNVLEKEKPREETPVSALKIDKLAKQDEEKVTSASPMDNKNIESSTVSDTEKLIEEIKEVIPSYTPQTDKLAKQDEEKETSPSPIDDKRKETSKSSESSTAISEKEKPKQEVTSAIPAGQNKETNSEVVLKPKSAEGNEKQLLPQDKEKKSENNNPTSDNKDGKDNKKE